MKRKMTTLMVLATLFTSIAGLANAAGAFDEWKSLYNGKNLDGWTQRNGKAPYEAKGDTIVGTTLKGEPNSFLCTDRDYANFIFEVEFKVDENLNSGIQIRSQSKADYNNFRVHGYQVEIDPATNPVTGKNPGFDNEPRSWTGGIYDEGRRGWINDLSKNEPARKAVIRGDWNKFRIRCVGDSIKTWLNGVPAADLKDSMTPSGFIALQVHGTSIDEPMQIAWRNIRLLDLDASHEKFLASDAFSKMEGYEYGQSREIFTTLEQGIHNATPQQANALEKKIIDILAAPKTTTACVSQLCRILWRAGTKDSIPVLSRLLVDEKNSDMARYALEQMEYPEVDGILRGALDKLKGNARVGVINSIAERGDKAAIGQLAALAADNDPATALAAIAALGRVGGAEGAVALRDLNVDEKTTRARHNAFLVCAAGLVQDGGGDLAARIYGKLVEMDDAPMTIRIAAACGLVKADPSKAEETIQAMLGFDDLSVQQAACKLIAETPDAGSTQAYADRLAAAPAAIQAPLLSALASRADKAAAPAVAALASAQGGEEAVRIAALNALITLAGPSEIAMLGEIACEKGKIGDAAQFTLGRISGGDVSKAIAMAASNQDVKPAARVRLIEAVAARNDKRATPGLGKTAEDANSDVRKAAQKALGALGGEKEIELLTAILIKCDDSTERRGIEQALGALAGRVGPDGCGAIVDALSKADGPAKESLLTLTPRIGTDKALGATRAALNGPAAKAAIRALGEWPTAAPMDDLLQIATLSSDNVSPVLAMRGYTRLIGLPSKRSNDETVALYEKVLKLARGPEEKRAALSGLGNVKTAKSLEVVLPYLDQEDTSNEAAAAAVSIIQDIRKKEKDASKKALEKIVAVKGLSGSIIKNAKTELDKMK